jgi:DNA-binding NarL/FixJ family response regulator
MPDAIRVLIVDDQALFRSGMAVIIDAEPGMQVVGAAADGREAIALIDELQPDIVLMDMRMPEMDGATSTMEIFAPARVARRSRPTRVIVLTTFDLDARAAAAIRYGASGFLLKDATPAALADAIRTVHSGSAVLEPTKLAALVQSAYRNRAPLPESFRTLSERERQVLDAVAQGLSNAEVAASLYLSEATVKSHLRSLLRKLGLRDRVQLVVFAYDHGLAGRSPSV